MRLKVFWFLLNILWAIFILKTQTQNCRSRIFCHNSEIKYKAFEAMNHSYLDNGTSILRSFQSDNVTGCLGECLKLFDCQSTNRYRNSSSNLTHCDLLSTNIWTDKDNLKGQDGSVHFYIRSPCLSNPCKNGGTCVPDYEVDGYKCICTSNNLTVWKQGYHCDNLTVGEYTASVFFDFNKLPVKDLTDARGNELTLLADTRILLVHDRKSPVLYLSGKSGSYAKSASYENDCIVNTVCSTFDQGTAISFWFRILKRSQDNFILSDCKRQKIIIFRGKSNSASRGQELLFRGCESDAFSFYLRKTTRSRILFWGSAKDETLYLQWNHFALTYHVHAGVTMYMNGHAVANSMSKKIGLSTRSQERNFVTFGEEESGIEMLLDDFAFWNKHLKEEDVKYLYNEGLARNLFFPRNN